MVIQVLGPLAVLAAAVLAATAQPWQALLGRGTQEVLEGAQTPVAAVEVLGLLVRRFLGTFLELEVQVYQALLMGF
jgi:hypothetical protein